MLCARYTAAELFWGFRGRHWRIDGNSNRLFARILFFRSLIRRQIFNCSFILLKKLNSTHDITDKNQTTRDICKLYSSTRSCLRKYISDASACSARKQVSRPRSHLSSFFPLFCRSTPGATIFSPAYIYTRSAGVRFRDSLSLLSPSVINFAHASIATHARLYGSVIFSPPPPHARGDYTRSHSLVVRILSFAPAPLLNYLPTIPHRHIVFSPRARAR